MAFAGAIQEVTVASLQMKKLLVSFYLCSAFSLQAQTAWFNIMGDPADETVNTVEVDPTPLSISGATRVMRVRVSRSADRVSWDGVPYRSYVSEVLFDCVSNTARHIAIDRYKQPGWKGGPPQRALYAQGESSPMQFRDIEPNPNQRIIRAACQSARILNN